MKTAILYYSTHHGNTKKLLDAIAEKHNVTLLDITHPITISLEEYDLIGFASGIYFSKFQKMLLQFAEQNLPLKKKVFFLYTCGAEKKGYTSAISKAVLSRDAEILGEYGCLGFDTYGPFKLIGGISNGHPNQDDLEGAVKFYESILN